MTATIQASEQGMSGDKMRVAIIVDVDPTLVAHYSSTGITESAHRDVRNIVDDVLGEVVEVMPETAYRRRLFGELGGGKMQIVPQPVPMSRTLPVSNEHTRVFGKRRTSLECATTIVAEMVRKGSIADGESPTEVALDMAREFAEFLTVPMPKAGA